MPKATGKGKGKGKFDWGDGKGKIHTVSKSQAYQASKAKRVKNDPYAAALAMATQAFAPAIRQVREQAINLDTHVAPGGGLDKAYDRSGQAIRDAQTASQNFNSAQVTGAEQFGQGMVASTAALGQEQVARAQEAQRLYGQTAQAAEEAAKTQGGAAISQAASASNRVGQLRAMGVAQSNAAPYLVGANEARRGESRVKFGQQRNELSSKLADLRSERGQDALKSALAQVKSDRDFELAMSTLNVKDKDSLRDYRASVAGIAQQAKQSELADENADADRSSRGTIAAEGNKSAEEIAAARNTSAERVAEANRKAAADRITAGRQPTAKDLALYDVNKNRKLDPGEAAGITGTGGKGKGATIYVERGGTAVDVSPSTRTKQVEARNRVGKYMSLAVQGLGEGRARNSTELMRSKSLKDRSLADFAIDYARAKARGDRYPIDRKYLAVLKNMFHNGQLPTDLARMVKPPG